MELHFAAPRLHGTWQDVISPRNSASEGLELALARVGRDAIETSAPGREAVLVILGGRCDVEVDGTRWRDLGERKNVFSGRGTAVYVPPGRVCTVESATGAEVALFRAPAPEQGEAYVVGPEQVEVVTRGEGAWRRQVHNLVDSSRPAGSLLVGETFNEPGAWSSYPPHKHDVHDPPRQAKLQEIYYFRMDPPQGFGIQRIYSPERSFDLSLTVEDGDSVIIPFGYHPVVAGPGYRLYYLWALAGEGRELRMMEDPAHSWVGS